jgi:hypothetical protein
MSGNFQPDYQPESRMQSVAVEALVEMARPRATFVDVTGQVLGLGRGDLAEVKLPVFQRGLKWNDDRLEQFHNSLIQGWPVGMLVLATESSRTINKKTGQRGFKLSLIDGQQRTWAFSRLMGEFWTQPWFVFSSPKWDATQSTPAGSIADAGLALSALAKALDATEKQIYDGTLAISLSGGAKAFDDYSEFLTKLIRELGLKPTTKAAARTAARKLVAAITQQFRDLKELKVPVVVLDESLKAHQPSIFRRLNQGVPLNGYDLLAATWEQDRLLTSSTSIADRKFLAEVLDVAETRIAATYADVTSGFVYEPNIDPLSTEDLSLFDLLYYLGRSIAAGPTFNINSDVLAFQVAALVFNGSINKVDDNLRRIFPHGADSSPDITLAPKLFREAGKNVELALKPLMDVTSKGVTLRGRIGLTPSAVYIATFLAHHNKVTKASGQRLALERRTASAADKAVSPGRIMTSNQRVSRLKATLPAWYVHDALTSVFAGSRAYEEVNNRVWAPPARGQRRLTPSNRMLDFPELADMLAAFDALWRGETDVLKTPQRRRISDGGSVLFRAAFAHLKVHDTVIDHVIPLAAGRAAADLLSANLPLNHVGNLMPLDETVNGNRKDEEWPIYKLRLTPAAQKAVKAALLVPWNSASTSTLVDWDTFIAFLSKRYRRMVGQALVNLQHETWLGLDAADKKVELAKLAIP